MYIVSQHIELSTKIETFDEKKKVRYKTPYVSIKIFIAEESNPMIQVKKFPSKVIMLEGQQVIDQVDENNNIYNVYKEINKVKYLEEIKEFIKEGDFII